ncbi:HugZ family protein [Halarcobacter ebronensis]|uniref:Heme iron utilization protein n=1 Tax=Halarcobacter ebronensis TaxID=1462615 RepID=A0A4Q1AXP9_9BACT|nr:pyridoxamine 5'-phosphate oxidase family protein [Halarcobacter ebronensis]QKF82303.1 heme utilization protein HutZ [Halarcobacter ebronensis]RXK07666.1 heme iron utilization protein [Halarcobacter ebronensis]
MLKDFIDSFKSSVISSTDKNGFPFSSYAPFIKIDGKFYIYISAMAKHYENLSINSKSTLFFIEDENSTSNIFARKRALLQCDVKKLLRETNEFDILIDEFEKRHGETVKILKKMKDFSFFEFTPFYGEAVFGFGEAYNIGGEKFEDLIQRGDLRGHQK